MTELQRAQAHLLAARNYLYRIRRHPRRFLTFQAENEFIAALEWATAAMVRERLSRMALRETQMQALAWAFRGIHHAFGGQTDAR